MALGSAMIKVLLLNENRGRGAMIAQALSDAM
jgi:hypothetical protein